MKGRGTHHLNLPIDSTLQVEVALHLRFESVPAWVVCSQHGGRGIISGFGCRTWGSGNHHPHSPHGQEMRCQYQTPAVPGLFLSCYLPRKSIPHKRCRGGRVGVENVGSDSWKLPRRLLGLTSATEHMGSAVYVLRTLDPWGGASG